MTFKYLLLTTTLILSSHASTRRLWSRRWHQSSIAGNWLYIDGGETGYAYDDVHTNMAFAHFDRENNTFGLDLSIDWTNSSLQMIQTERPPESPALIGEALWYDSKRDILYCFGGQRSYVTPALSNLKAPPDSIWGFKPNGQGSGVWNQVLGPDSTPFPSEIHRVAFGASASNGNTAYYLGGFGSWETSPGLQQNQSDLPGLLTFEFDTLGMTNSSDDDHFSSQKLGAMIDIPIYGENGVLVGLPDVLVSPNDGFNYITLYDKKNNKWYSQAASGDIPKARRSFCAVGIEGDEPPYFEIFIYGGVIDNLFQKQALNSDQVYILSMPSFRWFRANYTPASSRAGHTCHATASGQMIIIGGLDPSYYGQDFEDHDNHVSLDPWPQGLGVFDMTALRFKDSYQAKAQAYKTPDIIKNYHSIDGNTYPSSWTSAAIKELFKDKSNTPSGTATPSSSSISSISTSPSGSTSPSRLKGGAVAAIVVGIAVAFAFGGGATYMVKRRSARIRAIKPFNDAVSISPSSNPPFGELSAERRTQELLSVNQDRAELEQRYLTEIGTSEPTIPELSVEKDRPGV